MKTCSLWTTKHLLSMNQVSKEEILSVLDYASYLKENAPQDLFKGLILANCFFEPSTRTRLSFESAIKRLGGSVIGFSDDKSSSTQKGESFSDTIRVVGAYADLIVVRHPLEGAAARAAEVTDIPVINAGDGAHEHPSQTLLDLFSIRESQGRLEDLKIACIGDLYNGRTIHSLLHSLSHFSPRLYFVAPKGLELPKKLYEELKRKSLLFSFHDSVEEVLSKVDVAYISRIQTERLSPVLRERVKRDDFLLKKSMLENVKENFRIFHPLPRVFDIEPSIDHTPYAFYFDQVKNGVPVRQALISLLTGRGIE